MQSRIVSNVLFAASCVPSALLTAYILWFTRVFRPSGQEQLGDDAGIFHLAAWSYSISLAMIAVAIVLAVRARRMHPDTPSAGPLLFLASLALLFAPIAALFAASGS